MSARIRSDDMWNANTGAPATIRSVPANASGVASAVDSAWAPSPIPSAMALAIAAVLPHSDS